MGFDLHRIDKRIDESWAGKFFEQAKALLVRSGSGDALPAKAETSRFDSILALLFAVLAVCTAAHGQSAMPPGLYDNVSFNLWFQADQPRIIEALADRHSFNHYRDSVHPLFSLLCYPPAAMLQGLGLSVVSAAQILMLGAAFLCAFLLFLSLRHLGLPRWASALGCAAFLSSATFLYWFAIVETYALTALTSIATLYLLVRARGRTAAALLGSCISLSMTVTNWTLGLALTAMQFPLSRFLRISILALLICISLSLVQTRIFPSAGQFFRVHSVTNETKWTQTAMVERGEGEWTPLDNIRSVLLSSAVAPMPYRSVPNEHGRYIIDNQKLAPGSYDAVSIIAVLAWVAVLLLSIAGIIIDRKLTAPVVAMIGFMVGQLALHLFYGDITFLFAGNFFLIFVVLASLGSITRLRAPHAIALLCFILAGAVSNAGSFSKSVELLSTSMTRPG